jgi:Uma2 family endonuclease
MSEMDVFQVAPELGIPEVKPAIESIRGRWVRKVSPKTRHSLLQGRLTMELIMWAGDNGAVGSEWRFYMLPEGDKPSSLVPDVAYVSSGRMPPNVGELREKPTISPDIAAEILAPLDSKKTLREKIAIYFRFGSQLVIVVDPEERLVTMVEAKGERVFCEGETAVSSVYPDLRLEVAALFKNL